MKIETSLFPPRTSSQDLEGSSAFTANVPSYSTSIVPDCLTHQKSTFHTRANAPSTIPLVSPGISLMPTTIPLSTKTSDTPNYWSSSSDDKVIFPGDCDSSRIEFEDVNGEKTTSGFDTEIITLTESHPRERQQSIASDVTLVEQIDIDDFNIHTSYDEAIKENEVFQYSHRSNSRKKTNHLKERSITSANIDYTTPFILPPGALSGPPILLFEENPMLKFALKSKDPMVKYLNRALIEIINQAFENDNTWTIRRIEWIKTIETTKKELEMHKQDKITSRQQIKSLTLACEIIKEEVERVRQENFKIKKELMETQDKIQVLEKEKTLNQEKVMWNNIKTGR
ncbi:3572_t:CDS:2 [Acaulospora morrowiae]|uniref:3572_t:CDS:1 n=1 Tax=Acaulospora morrowiae TaxID=94023 RepID=A0A9N8ZZY7_9GLOM|nr:3572_t:CDS:2 [Acaulospora morrowiae]